MTHSSSGKKGDTTSTTRPPGAIVTSTHTPDARSTCCTMHSRAQIIFWFGFRVNASAHGINVDTFLDDGMEWLWNESTFSNHISRMLDSLHDETEAEECFFCNIDVRCTKACRDVTERVDRIKRDIVDGNDYFVRVVRVDDIDRPKRFFFTP